MRGLPPSRWSPPEGRQAAVFASLQFSCAPRTTSAFDDLFAVGVVVVRQFLTGLDVPPGADPDVLADDLAVAIRLAGVIDEPGDIPTNHRVANPAAIHRKTPDFTALEIPGLALVALLVIDELAFVADDPCVLVDWFESEDAEAVYSGFTTDDAG